MEPSILWDEHLPGAATWSHVLKRGTALRITDLEGNANVAAMFFNAENSTERFNLPDTLKAQHIARLTSGCVLYSDMGRVLCSITQDSLGWHDPLSGCSNAALVNRKYGEARYQEHRNKWHQNAKDGFLVELSKYGLGPRDLTANINLFAKVSVQLDGSMRFHPNHSAGGNYIELRAEMNVLIILNTCQHPLDPNPSYAPKPVQLILKKVAAPTADDPCRISCTENIRGFQLTERYFL